MRDRWSLRDPRSSDFGEGARRFDQPEPIDAVGPATQSTTVAEVGSRSPDPRLHHRAVGIVDSGNVGWRSGFGTGDLSGDVRAMVVWDDGSGEKLYVGGSIDIAGEHLVSNIASWDGSTWELRVPL
jgi:hypothetical protein